MNDADPQILYNALKALSAIHVYPLKVMNWVKVRVFTFKTLLIFLEYIFELLINTAPPVSDRKQNFQA